MRILLTTDTIGGVWAFTGELTTELLARGHAVALISLGCALSKAQQLWVDAVKETFGRNFFFAGSSVPLEWMPDNANAYSGALPLLVAVAEDFRAELIHASQFCFGDLPLSLPVVVTAHSDVFSWAEICQPQGLPASRWIVHYHEIVQQGLMSASAIVAPTQWMLDALQRHFRFGTTGCVILNGRSIAVRAIKVRRLQAVSVGRLWDEAKNLTLLTIIQSPIPLFITGEVRHDGSSAPSETGTTQALGQLDEDALMSLFAESSVYIAPSRYEPFGLAPLEAAQCGCAVLLNDIPSLREVWGEEALYFQDRLTLETQLHLLAESPHALEEAQRRARSHACLLTGARMADSYIALYRGLLQTQGAEQEEMLVDA